MAQSVQTRGGGREWLRDALPKLVLSPSFAIVLIFVYGFILFTLYLSFTDSKILPSFGWVGLAELPAAVRAPGLGDRRQQPADLRLRSTS